MPHIGEVISRQAKKRKKRSFDTAGTNVRVGAVLGIAEGLKRKKKKFKNKDIFSKAKLAFPVPIRSKRKKSKLTTVRKKLAKSKAAKLSGVQTSDAERKRLKRKLR